MKAPEETKTIIVPVDFTEITANALIHATELAKLFGKPLTLLHVVGKGFLEKNSEIIIEEEEALSKLENLAEDVFSESGVSCSALVRRGSIYDTIGEVAKELNATLVVMATHGVKGLQHIFGSRAIKVIYRAEQVPFVVVQQRPIGEHGYKNIVLPFSFGVESKQKLAWTIHLNKIFDCTFHILAESDDDEFIARKIKNNLVFAERYLKKHNCKYTVHHAPKNTAFHKDIIKFAASIFADMIIIMTSEDKDWSDYFSGPNEQDIIANPAQIPVFCLNPVDNMQIVSAAMFQ